MRLYANHIELFIDPDIHLATEDFFQILNTKTTHYDFPIGLLVIRKDKFHQYSIDPLIFMKFKNEFETHLKWYALISPNKLGFENLVYLKQMTNVKVYSFLNYEDALPLLENSDCY
ncbi:hypothetical protein [Mesonia sp.]|uniref:hypothetical protein n=1 Tax=Mesonia sp. TaxID=1960830 RepID=UPI00175DFBAE|nr:hypothetical protein [Mesonia sp.]HIB38291.1 hypothetical protein [Mesonia sp.]HIO26485.1 hypothetical protein [Flavobacteriaceae bacterium]